MTENRKIALAVAASAAVHVALFFLMVAWVALMPEFELVDKEDKPLELVIEPEMQEQLLAIATPTPPPARRVLDTVGLNETEEAPENARFESDKNSRAASELPASGDAPMPSQEGRDREHPKFDNTQMLQGPPDAAPGVASLPGMIVQPAPPEEEPTPAPREPIFKPTPRPEPAAIPEAAPGELPRPTPAPNASKATPSPTPTPAPTPKRTPDREQLAMNRPTPRPMPPGFRPSAPGYQAQREQTRIEGNISNRGKRGVDTVGTPLGRYQKQIGAAIGSRWNYYVGRNMDVISVGSVQIHFFVAADGRTQHIEVLDNSSNSAFANVCVQAITQAEIPPIPGEVAAKLDGNRLEIDYTFTIYPN